MSMILRMLAVAAIVVFCAAGASHAAEGVRAAYAMDANSPPYRQTQILLEKFEQRFPGVLSIRQYPSNQLGNEKALVKQVQAGAIELIAISSEVIALDRRLGVFDLPWLFKDSAHAKRAVKGELGKEIKKLLEEKHNLVVLGIYSLGFRTLLNRVRPINTPEDLNGLKIRVTGGKYRLDALKAMGANPVPVPWPDVYTSMQTHVIDGVDSIMSGFEEQKLYEVGQYITLTNHLFGPVFLLASKSFMARLTPEQKAGLHQIADDITDEAFALADEIDRKSMEALSTRAKINKIDVDAFMKKSAPQFDAFAKDVGGEWLKMVQAVRDTK